MDRNCFICNEEIEPIVISNWLLPGFNDRKRIGFGICKKCELVLQTPTISPKEMTYYYEQTATYINPGREGKPSSLKIKDVERQVSFLSDFIQDPKDNSIFQIGCSDGYTLSKFKEKGFSVSGVDPSIESNKLAKELYDIDTIIDTFENIKLNQKFDILVMTHILEHLYNPNQVLEKCNKILNKDGYILLEVPLFEGSKLFPIGMLTLEHLNYFTEKSLLKLFSENSFIPLSIQKLYFNHVYPVIAVVFKKMEKSFSLIESFGNNMNRYLNLEQSHWKKVQYVLNNNLKKNEEVYIWGAGIHTSMLLSNTNLLTFCKIVGILDSSKTKWNKNLGDVKIIEPTVEKLRDSVVVISSYVSEEEIYKYINLKFKCKKIIKLYKEEDYNEFIVSRRL